MKIRNKRIRAGQPIFSLIGAANRDPAVFSDPNTLDIGRKKTSHLSFGRGIHYCLGASLAVAEQIYDEGLIWHTTRIFVKQFRNFELGALTGPIEEDRYRTVPGPVGSTTDSTATPIGPGNIPGGITSEDTSSVVVNESDTTRTITQRIDRRSIFFSEGHTVTTTAEQDYTEAERREIRKTFLSMFDGLPRDVRIVIELVSIQYHGQTATVTAQWKYDIVGHATRLSSPYKNRSPGSLTLQMLRAGDSWLVTDFRGLVNGLKTDVTSR